jgi:hypothetical protein
MFWLHAPHAESFPGKVRFGIGRGVSKVLGR